ncbi:MAG: hypothetical protein AAB691_00165 [Patescibacteria group bacterium]
MSFPSRLIFFGSIAFVTILCVVFFVGQPANGASADLKLEGWIWSPNIGWISFCGGKNTFNCPGPSSAAYQVIIDNNTGAFSGYAWTPNAGWLSFNRNQTRTPPGAPFNSSGATSTAWIDPLASTKKMEGWGRFLAGCDFTVDTDGDGKADQCVSSGPGINSGGWDGWVSFSEGITSVTRQPYPGFVASKSGTKGVLLGYAWGSDVVGWLVANSVTTNFAPAPQATLPEIDVTMTTSPSCGQAPIRVSLTATVSTTSNLPMIYQFICDEKGKNPSSGTILTASTTATFACRYNAGTYKPLVSVNQNGVFGMAPDASISLNSCDGLGGNKYKQGGRIEIAPDE